MIHFLSGLKKKIRLILIRKELIEEAQKIMPETMAGKLELADLLLEEGIIKTKEEYFKFIEGEKR